MPEPLDTKNCQGVRCELVMPDCWQFRIAEGPPWYYELWGRKLRHKEVVVAEGINSLPYAVTFALGYEASAADIVRLVRKVLGVSLAGEIAKVVGAPNRLELWRKEQ